MAVTRAALGFRLHTGWAAVVAVAGRPGKLEILLRKRIELLPANGAIPRFVYHRAAEMERPAAEALVKRAAAAARKTARVALADMVDDLRANSVHIIAAGVPTGSTSVPPDLAKILAAHPWLHAAEGKLFQKAVAGACEASALHVACPRERDLWPFAAERYGMSADTFRKALDDLRRSVGPPWSADQKTAAAVALLALAESRATARP